MFERKSFILELLTVSVLLHFGFAVSAADDGGFLRVLQGLREHVREGLFESDAVR